MADITGFTITSTDFDTGGGMTITGSYTGGGNTDNTSGGPNTPTNDEDIFLQVQLDDGSWVDLGNPTFTFGSNANQKTFSLVLDSTDLARFTNGTALRDNSNAVFRFYDKETSNDGDNEAAGPVNVSPTTDGDGNAQTYTHTINTPGILGITVNTATSELNPSGGITLKGNFSGGGTSTSTTDNDADIVVQVREVGTSTWYTLSGTFTWDFATHSYQFVTTDSDLNRYALNNNVEFRFVDDQNTDWTTSDDVVLSTTPSITLCFYPGTMIATPEGEKAVETLAIGDLVLRQDGSSVAVRWMGRNTVSLLFADKLKSLPIRIRKDALAENVPSRDLLVSPDHAIFVDGILAQAGALVNGTSIVRETDVPSKFVYHHVELADHALIVAENTPAESFVDNVDRMAYDNWAEHEALFGDLPPIEEMDLPRAKSQRQIPTATRQRIAARAIELGYFAVTSAVA